MADEIRVELTPSNGAWILRASIGDTDVTEHLLRLAMINFKPYIPMANRNYMRINLQRGRRLDRFLRDGLRASAYDEPGAAIPPAVLADAIKAYLTETAPEMTGPDGVVSTTESDMVTAEQIAASMAPVLMIGGKMYRLNAVAQSGTPVKLLDRMRTKAVEAINREKLALMESVKRETAIVRRQITHDREQLERDRTQFRIGQANQHVLPPWLLGQVVIQAAGGSVWVMQPLRYAPELFTFPNFQMWVLDPRGEARGPDGERGRYESVNLSWRAAEADPVFTSYWLLMDREGRFSIETFKITSWGEQLPHASNSRFCAAVQGLPERITSPNDMTRVTLALQRVFNEVNMSSFLVPPASLSSSVNAFMDGGVCEFWEYIMHNSAFVTRQQLAEWGATIEVPETGHTIWQAEQARR